MSLFDSASVVITPSGYKEDKLYSIKPTDGSGDLVVTRATTATRVNSAGLIEVVPRNLLTYSNTFTDASWIKGNVTLTANAIANPINGIVDAYRVNITSTGVTNLFQEIIKGAGNYTVSVFVKKAETQYVNLGFIYNAGRWSGTQFDLNSGTILRNNANTYTFVNSTITNLGNGWFKLTHTATTDTNEAYPFSSPSNAIWSSGEPRQTLTGNNTTGAYFFGMQIEVGSTATEYFPTTDRLNVPRLDYTNSTCPSILVEPQRTNLLTYSEQFDNVSWIKSNLSITANATTAPDGTLTADKLVENSSNANHLVQKAVVASNAVYTFSVFAKKSERNWVVLRGVNASFQNVKAWFNIDAGTIGTLENGATAKITNVGNGWYKLEMTIPSFSTGFEFRVSTSTGNNVDSYTGDGTSGLFIWGAQLEAGSYATSYIPTVASSVTRNADVISKTGISSLIGQTEGTLFMDCKINALPLDGSFFGIQKTSSNFVIRFGSNGSVIYAQSYNGSTNLFYQTFSYTLGSRIKAAFAYKAGSYAFYINGVQIGTGSNATTIPTCDATMFNSLWGSFNDSLSFYSAAALWKTRLSNTELATLTTI